MESLKREERIAIVSLIVSATLALAPDEMRCIFGLNSCSSFAIAILARSYFSCFILGMIVFLDTKGIVNETTGKRETGSELMSMLFALVVSIAIAKYLQLH